MKSTLCNLLVLTLALAATGTSTSPAQSLTVKGSDTLVALDQRWAEAYRGKHPGVEIQVAGGGVGPAFVALGEKKAALATVSRSIRFKEAQACETALGKRPAEYKLAVYGVAVYVHADNPLKEITYDDLFAVFRGKFKNWKELGGPDAPITLYGTETNSAAGELFGDEVLNGKEAAASLGIVPGASLLETIAKDKNGIGYGALTQAVGTRALAIKRAPSSTPVEPSEETISKRTYPVARYVYGYVDPASDQGETRAYLDWIRSDAGQEMVKAAGYFPLPPKWRSTPKS